MILSTFAIAKVLQIGDLTLTKMVNFLNRVGKLKNKKAQCWAHSCG